MIGSNCGCKEEGLAVGGINSNLGDSFRKLHTVFIYVEHLHDLVRLARYIVSMRRGKDDVLFAVVFGQSCARRRLGSTACEIRHIKDILFVACCYRHLCSNFSRTGKKQIKLVLTLVHP